ncbi:hypothetical protein ABEF92_002864 [Exophiala dermatitidis]|uniref:Uncharacterized protein n=1 Tax=Exophiala dermatitidis (strain ATCC 34100 / CBS 525.76 / NIH/UT8656) TaxID=858893 RepID=H6C2Y3_EXODN|nr:uncharacterized protein HMPREF1120_06016 [Exophiala dermatitidis NIH/UT8656]EHY57998.1 hypothetical protein HMPREF1120_06016 [Exophiala dermatitidis NIH/UT8656]
MGKLKEKSLRSPPASNHFREIISEASSTTGSVASSKAADGHNVEGWAEEDIRIYNELLSERAKLEKEKHELEQKSSKHQAQRALLDENSTALDSLFRAQFGGEFKFTGDSSCCLDARGGNACAKDHMAKGLPCGHEICTRAKTKGVSWMEMDTIKYYHARIMSEKSPRMQDALRKQRDVELVRVKKEDEEEIAWRARKAAMTDKALGNGFDRPDKEVRQYESASDVVPAALDMIAPREVLLDPKNSAILEAAKENEHVVRQIRARLDRIRQDVNAGKVSSADARVSLDQANREMAEAERKNDAFRKLILDAEPALSQVLPADSATLSNALHTSLTSSTASDAFTTTLGMMSCFLNTCDPRDVQAAIGELRQALEVNGPLSTVLQESLKTLQDILSRSKAEDTPDDAAADEEARAWRKFLDTMLNVKQKLKGSGAASSVAAFLEMPTTEETIKTKHECTKVEEAARKDMEKIMEKMSGDTVENITAALRKVKSKAVLKSPIPPFSEMALENTITDLLHLRTAKALVAEAASDDASDSLISGKLTSVVMNMARKDPERFQATMDTVKLAINKSLETQKKTAPPLLSQAIAKVEGSIPKFVAAHRKKLAQKAGATDPINPPGERSSSLVTLQPLTEVDKDKTLPLAFGEYLLSDRILDKESWKAFRDFFDTDPPPSNDQARKRVMAHYGKHWPEGIWEIFRVVIDHHPRHTFRFEPWKAKKELYRNNMSFFAIVGPQAVPKSIMQFQKRGVCPAMTAVAVAQGFTYHIRTDPSALEDQGPRPLEYFSQVFHSIYAFCDPVESPDWFGAFDNIGNAMIDLLDYLVSQARGIDPRAAEVLATDVVVMVATFVLTAESRAIAVNNVHAIHAFILENLIDGQDGLDELQRILFYFLCMCKDSRYRCSPNHPCTTHVVDFVAEQVEAYEPIPDENPWGDVVASVTENVPPPTKQDVEPQSMEFQKYHGHNGEPVPDYLAPLLRQFLKLPPGSHPWAEPMLSVGTYHECVRKLDRAIFHGPHRLCMQLGKDCNCTKHDKELFSFLQTRRTTIATGLDEVRACIRRGQDVPGDVWTPLDEAAKEVVNRIEHYENDGEADSDSGETGAQAKSRFTELLEHIPASRDAQRAKFKHVPVNVPNIQNHASSSPSARANPGDYSSEAAASSSRQTARKPSAGTKPWTSELTKATATSSRTTTILSRSAGPSTTMEAPPMTKKELRIMTQLKKLDDGIRRMNSKFDEIEGQSAREALQGINLRFREMARGHIDAAYIMADGNDYSGLRAWLDYNYGRNPAGHTVSDRDSDDDGDDEDNDGEEDATTSEETITKNIGSAEAQGQSEGSGSAITQAWGSTLASAPKDAATATHGEGAGAGPSSMPPQKKTGGRGKGKRGSKRKH